MRSLEQNGWGGGGDVGETKGAWWPGSFVVFSVWFSDSATSLNDLGEVRIPLRASALPFPDGSAGSQGGS
jgi:hypothetical protein